MHFKMFSSIPGLCSLDFSHDNQKCLQTLQNVPWVTKLLLVDIHGVKDNEVILYCLFFLT